jgi:hypothetical protein
MASKKSISLLQNLLLFSQVSKAPSLEQTMWFVSTRQDLGICSKHTKKRVLRRLVFELVPILSWKEEEKEIIVISKLFHVEVFKYTQLRPLLEIIAWRHKIATVLAMCPSCTWTQLTDFLIKDCRLHPKNSRHFTN